MQQLMDGNDLSIINAGVGYTPSADVLTYSNIPMVTLTGSGSGAVGDVTVVNGKIGVVTFTNGGSNYVVGDTVGVGTLGKGNGSGDVIAIGVVTTSNTLLVDNVQGSFNIGVGTVLFNNGSAILSLDGKTGIGTTVDGQIGSAATVSSFEVDPVFDGLHFKVNHRAHGMHNISNRVSIKGIKPDTPITTLTADYTQSSLGNISVVDCIKFCNI